MKQSNLSKSFGCSDRCGNEMQVTISVDVTDKCHPRFRDHGAVMLDFARNNGVWMVRLNAPYGTSRSSAYALVCRARDIHNNDKETAGFRAYAVALGLAGRDVRTLFEIFDREIPASADARR